MSLGSSQLRQREQPPIAGAQVQDAPDVRWQELQHHRFAFCAMGNLVGHCQVRQSMTRFGIFIELR